MSDRKPGQHRWKLSWPGNFCLDCGLDDPLEGDDALISCDCKPPAEPTLMNGCQKCCGTGALPNPDLVIPPCPASSVCGKHGCMLPVGHHWDCMPKAT